MKPRTQKQPFQSNNPSGGNTTDRMGLLGAFLLYGLAMMTIARRWRRCRLRRRCSPIAQAQLLDLIQKEQGYPADGG